MSYTKPNLLLNKLKHPISARLSRGLGAHGVMQMINLIIRFAEVPLLIGAWGATGYGEWLMIAAIPTALSLCDGGITKTARREMIILAGKGDIHAIPRVFQSTWVTITAISILVISITSTTLELIPISDWLKIKSIDQSTLALALIILSGASLLNLQSSLLYGLFSARKEYATAELHIALLFGTSFALMSITVLLGGGMLAAAAANFSGSLIGYLAMYINIIRKTDQTWYGWTCASFSEIKKLAPPSFANLAFPIGEAINMQGMRILIGLTLGPAALASFSSLRTLCRAVIQPLMAVSRTVEPEVSLAYGANDTSRVIKIFNYGTKITLGGSLLLSILLLTLGPWVYSIWTMAKLSLEWELFLILIASSIFGALGGMALVIPCATNRHMNISFVFLMIQLTGCTILAWASIQLMGLSGAGIAALIIDAAVAFTAIKASMKLLKSTH